MASRFDVFRNDKPIGLTWLAEVNSMEEGEAHARELAAESPGEYFILIQCAGSERIVNTKPQNARLPARATPILAR
jgi:hypothetical protein